MHMINYFLCIINIVLYEVQLDSFYGCYTINKVKLCTFNSCNTGISGLPDMCTQSSRAEGGHIRQTTRACVTTIKCNTFTPKIKGTCSAT